AGRRGRRGPRAGVRDLGGRGVVAGVVAVDDDRRATSASAGLLHRGAGVVVLEDPGVALGALARPALAAPLAGAATVAVARVAGAQRLGDAGRRRVAVLGGVLGEDRDAVLHDVGAGDRVDRGVGDREELILVDLRGRGVVEIGAGVLAAVPDP